MTPSPVGVTVRSLKNPTDADAMNRVYVRCGMVPAPVETIWDNHLHANAVTYLLAVRDDDGAVVGTVTGVDHELLFSDPEHGASLWALAVDPAAAVPGVGGALSRALAEHFRRLGRSYLDLSVAHDNAAAIALYEKLGFRRVPVLAIKRKNAINEPLFTPLPETVDDLNPFARSSPTRRCAVESGSRSSTPRPARCGTHPRRSQRAHPRIAVRVHLGHRHVPLRRQAPDPAAGCPKAGIIVPRARLATFDEGDHDFLREVGEVVVKPTRGEQGKGITVGVLADSGPDELAAALARAKKQHPEVLIEQRVSGSDLRLVVIDGRVVAAALRLPPEIIGTGDHTVRELILAASRGQNFLALLTLPPDETTPFEGMAQMISLVIDEAYRRCTEVPDGAPKRYRKGVEPLVDSGDRASIGIKLASEPTRSGAMSSTRSASMRSSGSPRSLSAMRCRCSRT